MLSGGPGTGKTIFGLQFIYEGLKNGETCLIITFEETSEELFNDALQFGWNLKKYVEEGKLIIKYYSPVEMDAFFNEFEKVIVEVAPSRMLIDSITVLATYSKDLFIARKVIHEISKISKSLEITTIFTSEVQAEYSFKGIPKLSLLGIEEFIADGVIFLRYSGIGNYGRSLEIIKMRRTNHKRGIIPYKIGENGIEIGEIYE